MSEPVTNVEIEDVLSSIRRLVAEGDKSRPQADPAEKQAERFVLTPALRVAEPEVEGAPEAEEIADLSDESKALAEQFVAPIAEPLVLEPTSMLETAIVHDRMTETERAGLEATIAELEAAVTVAPDDEWEPDDVQTKPSLGLAAAFAAMADDIEDADEIVQERVVHLRTEPQEEPTFRHVVTEMPDDEEGTDYGDELRENEDDGMPIPDDLDETLAAYITEGTQLDRAEMRQMIVEVVRQELQGELGERISRNVRKMVRREIQRATTANIYD